MDEKAALKRIFDAQALCVKRQKEEERLKDAHKAAKAELDEASAALVQVIEEYRTGQDQLPFEGAAGQIADQARMDDPPATVPPAEASKRRRAK
jgi:hypothetical protein